MVKMSFFEKILVNSRFNILFHKWFGINKLLSWAGILQTKKIFEIGCGVGITTMFIANKYPNSKIIALDYDSSQIQMAKKISKLKNVEFVIGDATKLRYKSESFEIIIQVLAFHHIPQYEKAMKEVYRILKKDGRFILMDMAIRSINPFHRLFKVEPAEFTKKEFIDQLERNGFKIIKTKGKLLFSVMATKK